MKTTIKKMFAFPFIVIFSILLVMWGVVAIPTILSFSLPTFVLYAMWHDYDVSDAIQESWNFSTDMVVSTLEDMWSDYI